MASCSSSSAGLRTRSLVVACAERSIEARSSAMRSARESSSSGGTTTSRSPASGGVRGVEHLANHRGVVEVGGGQPVPGEHDGEPRQRQPDPDLVESQSEWSVDTETHVGRHQENAPAGKPWPVQAIAAGAGKDRMRSANDPQSQEGDDILAGAAECPQLEPRREAARPCRRP